MADGMPDETTSATDAAASVAGRYAVLWDVDGVIIDSGEQHRAAWHQMATEEGLPYSDEAFWATFGMRNEDIMPQTFGIHDRARATALAARKEVIYRELLTREAVALPGAKDLLIALRAAGYRQVLGSSAPLENLRVIVAMLGLGDLLDGVVSGETVAHGKPAPDIFLAAATLAGCAPAHCLVIEDAPAGVAAAHAGGMRCLAVRRAGQADAPGLEAAEYIADSLLVVTVGLVGRLLGVRG